MPKHRTRRGRKRSGFVAIPFNVQAPLAALADETVVLQDILSAALVRDLYVISIDCAWYMRGHTATEGGFNFGWAHNDLTVAEVSEALNAEMADPGDIIARERARRPVRRAGAFLGNAIIETVFDGRQERVRMKFTIGEGHNLAAWFLNRSGGTFTTGTIVEMNGVIYGRWA